MRRFSKLYFFVVLTIIAIIVYMFVSIDKIENELRSNIQNIFITQAKSLASNIETKIKRTYPEGISKKAFENSKKRIQLQESVELLITPVYQYVYVLYKDKNGNYRYFVDGSPFEERGEFDQKLDVDKTKWDRVYETRKDLVFKQNLETVWTTLLHPVAYCDETELIVAIDFSMKLPLEVTETIEPLKTLFVYVFVAIAVLVLIVLFQIFSSIKMKKQSYIDPLTGAYNRNFLRDFITAQDINSFAILMVDIDHFKQINDSYGHKVGDMVLRDVAHLFGECLRQEDVVVRFGGEEFLIFLKNEVKNPEELLKVVKRLHATIERHSFFYDGLVLKVTVSIGVNLEPHHFKSTSDAIKHADELLYTAKRTGRNKIVTDSGYQQRCENNKKSIYETKEALEEGRILCYYQPIIDAKTDTIVKYEALVRMIDKDDTVIAPPFFLQNILHTNLYNELTKLVVHEVFATIKRTSNAISINLNFSDIVDEKLFKIIIEEIEANKEVADKLTVELLEYEVLENYENVKKNISKIRSYGVRIALDDFGSGYANYTVFKEIDIDIIKIDGSIIKDIETSEVLYDIAKSIVVLAKSLNIETVAEFVHSKGVYEKIKELDITYAQGFYLGKPEKMDY